MPDILGDVINPVGVTFSLLALLAVLAVIGAVIAGTVVLIGVLVKKKKRGKTA